VVHLHVACNATPEGAKRMAWEATDRRPLHTVRAWRRAGQEALVAGRGGVNLGDATTFRDENKQRG
jgi:hypothetical protein